MIRRIEGESWNSGKKFGFLIKAKEKKLGGENEKNEDTIYAIYSSSSNDFNVIDSVQSRGGRCTVVA
ncbi:hypothetical protein C5S39_06365 [Candidatus Methanophagaceae archaeon]|jgi:hypothetical protein|nr:hypothetical protein C5S39_06365 [Methanophagales archaeon]